MLRLTAIVFITLFFTACASNEATVPTQPQGQYEQESDDTFDEFADEDFDIKKTFDPLSGYNRFMTGFNDKFFEYVLDPVAQGYAWLVPEPARESVQNFVHNLLYPIRGINNLLQLKFKNTLEETGRFIINTTIGILGLFDPAKTFFGLEKHEEDFGQTLGYWGVGSGFHIVLPFLGPSNLRDALSLYPDSFTSPLYYFEQRGANLLPNGKATLPIIMYDTLNDESLRLGDYKRLKEDAVDLYPYLRDIYEQNRDRQIKE